MDKMLEDGEKVPDEISPESSKSPRKITGKIQSHAFATSFHKRPDYFYRGRCTTQITERMPRPGSISYEIARTPQMTPKPLNSPAPHMKSVSPETISETGRAVYKVIEEADVFIPRGTAYFRKYRRKTGTEVEIDVAQSHGLRHNKTEKSGT